jgi:thioredoxin reductase (NADPH)
MREQSLRFGTEIITETVSRVDLSKRPFKYWTEFSEEGSPDTADTIIIATGASARRLDLPGEDKYWQNGISACAVCDGAVPIFRNKHLVVIGGGDSAAEEAIFLTKYGSEVTVLVRRDVLRASKTMAKRLSSHPKVKILYNTVAVEVKGGEKGLMNALRVKNVKTGEETELDANGLFYAVGHDPATALVKGQVKTDSEGYIITEPGTSYTSVKGVFAAGDVQDKKYRQAITSAGTGPPPYHHHHHHHHHPPQPNQKHANPPKSGSGCIAALEAERLLAEEEASEIESVPAEKSQVNGIVPEYSSDPLP